jgi:hypothetical protein
MPPDTKQSDSRVPGFTLFFQPKPCFSANSQAPFQPHVSYALRQHRKLGNWGHSCG